MQTRHDLTDDQWSLLEPLLPAERPGRKGRPWSPHRRVINGVLWRTRTGSPWRDLPSEYGPWATVYGRHRTWSADGTWEKVLTDLQRGSDGEVVEWVVSVDSTSVRAHHHAAGAPKAAPADVAAERLAVFLADVPTDVPIGEDAVAAQEVSGEPERDTGGDVE